MKQDRRKEEAQAPSAASRKLFAGCGAFTLRLAEDFAVHAVEAERGRSPRSIALLRETPGLKPVSHERRDLFRRPLLRPAPGELGAF